MNATIRDSLRRATVASVVVLMAATSAQAVEVLIPSYFYPAGANNGWPQLTTAASQVPITAILNPNSGPGTSVDSTYTSAVNSLRDAGGRVIGYVSTVYSTRPIAQVKADILKYTSLYPVDGFFLDEMTNTGGTVELAYYAEVYGYIKSLNADFRVTANPGTNTLPAYLSTPTTDSLVTFETDVGYPAWNPSAWTSNYATRRFVNLPYNIPDAASMQTAVNAAVTKRVGHVYVTDDNGANPWDRLPTYWNAEVSALRAVTPTWANSGSGDWKTAANWTTPAAPNAVGAEAMLFGAIASQQTLYTNSPITLGTLVLNNANRYAITGAGSLTMDAAVETALIDVRKGNHTINLPLVLADTTNVFVQGGASLTIADPMTINAGKSLVKQGAGTLNIISLVTQLAAPTIVVKGGRVALGESTAIGSISIALGASVDIGAATVTIHSNSIDSIRADLRAAFETSNMTGLFSSAADQVHALSYVLAEPGVEIRLAKVGDATLDDEVGFDDLLLLAESFGRTDQYWTNGDFNYDGTVNEQDLAAIERAYSDPSHTGIFEGDWQLAKSLAPEPATFLICVSGLTILARRRV